ncbi:MAG: restriction endonuclease [Lachnospiraceae bacterium]|nr:restriction endonuclease [Lachnospiraceae bacterium]
MKTQMNSQLLITVAIIAGVILLAVLGVLVCRQFRRYAWTRERDHMDGFEFEYYCADLLAGNGFYNVKVTRSSGDYGIDILAEKDGVTYAIQCKRYTGLVGIKAVQEAYSGRDYYDRMVGAVLTNQYFTKSAVQAARKLKILLWDRDYLQEMEKN